MIVTQYSLKPPKPEHIDAIFSILKESESEIPLRLDSYAHINIIKEIVEACLNSGFSWTATDYSNHIVRFLLVDIDRYECFLGDEDVLAIKYAVVRRVSRKAKVFHSLIRGIKKQNMPLTAVVKAENQSFMADLLSRYGFQECSVNSGVDRQFKWQPGTVNFLIPN